MIDNNMTQSDDEISLLDISDFFRENSRKILFGGFICGLLGVAYAFTVPPKYQATSLIQVAKVANSDVEAPNTLLEKLQNPTYYSQKTYASCKVEDSREPGVAIAESLKPKLAKNAPLISVSYKAKSVEDAKNCLESVLNDIRKNENEIAKPTLEQIKNQLALLKSKLELAEHITNLLSNQKLNFDYSDSKFSAATLLLTSRLIQEQEVKDLRTQISDLEINLSEPQTKEADFVTPIYAPNIQVEPKRILISIGALFGGLVLMVGYVLLRKSWINLKKPNK